MKAFEEWQEKALKNYLSPNVSLGAEMGWEAALEWVLTQRTTGIEEDGSISYCNYVSLDVIKEELND
jgi:hypothetical protein